MPIIPITGYYWDFGDGFTSTEENPSHTYSGVGNYIVTHTQTNASGEQSTVSLPIKSFIATNIPITGRYWDFGNSETSTNASEEITYDNPGVYVVSYTETNASGDESTTKQVITINRNYDFDTYWTYGDGASGIGNNPSHIYTEQGIASGTAFVSGYFGTDSDVFEITVLKALPLPLKYKNQQGNPKVSRLIRESNLVKGHQISTGSEWVKDQIIKKKSKNLSPESNNTIPNTDRQLEIYRFYTKT